MYSLVQVDLVKKYVAAVVVAKSPIQTAVANNQDIYDTQGHQCHYKHCYNQDFNHLI